MIVQITLERLPSEDDPEAFAAFLCDWLEEELKAHRPRVTVQFGDRFQVLVNGLEHSERSWLVENYYAEARGDYQARRAYAAPLSLLN